MKHQLKLFISVFLLSTSYCIELFANDNSPSSGSKRIQVYSVSQNFWDVKSGETLSGITKQVLPDNPEMRASLSQQIIDLNPVAFISGDANRLIANIRLWLPNGVPVTPEKYKEGNYEIRSFSWGQSYKIKR